MQIPLHMSILPECMYIHHVYLFHHRDWKRALDPPGTGVPSGCWELNWSSVRAASTFDCGGISPAPPFFFKLAN